MTETVTTLKVYAIALSRGLSLTPNAQMQYVDSRFLHIDVDSKVMLATFETACVESHFNNLNCGDQARSGCSSNVHLKDGELLRNAET
jgi:hypothetical protein